MNPGLEIKICGLTEPDEAAACADAGADAIGIVFHPASPRCVSAERARAICASVPERTARVGVFVDHDARAIRSAADKAGLTAVQLHGDPAQAAGRELLQSGLRVVYVLRRAGALAKDARRLPSGAGVLVECGRGPLPGGNGIGWDWSRAAALAGIRPFAVAGGLAPDNVGRALLLSRASAVDVSSGVETAPGRKNLAEVKRLVAAVRGLEARDPAEPVFSGRMPTP